MKTREKKIQAKRVSGFRDILCMNRRNACYTLAANERRLYPIVDCKLLTKTTLAPHGVPMPDTYCEINHTFEVKRLTSVEARSEFVIKPARGSQGHGIMVIVGKDGDAWRTASGERVTREDIEYHLYNILAGLFSLGGVDDRAYFEYLLKLHPLFIPISYRGIPDMRVILYKGIPIMAMLRLPTKRSQGKANLHQGAIGTGIELLTGRTVGGVFDKEIIDHHPDTKNPIAGIDIPFWQDILSHAMKIADIIGLGYFGVDFVIDAERGPLVLEVNARPGLAIQIANQQGLRPRLTYIDKLKIKKKFPPHEERHAIMRAIIQHVQGK
jgi:alpha-L-glutamate ligase-like protein